MLINVLRRPLTNLLRKMSAKTCDKENIIWVDLEVSVNFKIVLTLLTLKFYTLTKFKIVSM